MINVTHYQRNANQNHNKYHWHGTILCLSEGLLSKSLQTINVGEGVEKMKPSSLSTGMQVDTATMKEVWRFLKKLGIKPSYNPAIPLLGIYQL